MKTNIVDCSFRPAGDTKDKPAPVEVNCGFDPDPDKTEEAKPAVDPNAAPKSARRQV